MRILFVYGFEPSGHASAARALEAAASSAGHDCVSVNVSGSFHRRLGPLVARAYLGLIARLPRLWSRLYDNEAVARIVSCWRWLYCGLFGARLRRTLAALSPDVVVCTHAPPLAALALEKSREGFAWPLVAVVTDYRVHAYWLPPQPADLYVTADEDSRVPPGRRCASGIPIHPLFETPPSRAEARARLGLPADAPVLVLSGGSRGLGRLAALADALLARLPRARVLAVCGSNRGLARALKEKAAASSGRLWVFERASPAQIVEVKAAADLLVGKAGGVTSAECMALGLPMVVFEPIPGQERRNADHLVARGAAVEAFSIDEAARRTEELLAPESLERARENARGLGRPDAARRALEAIAARAKITK